ncbi:MAG: hypothetical protein KZQ77_02845, partial [Candidatus Thiodiazotropha sp. (ex Notomyrtea botanica)]|nr:hypothetical protein [Candidatus Thiodiazotropha sp. (ex Notomyrtea botanica)]
MNRNDIKANIDQASCGNGVIYIVGWGFIDQGNDHKTKLILEGTLDKNRVEIPLRHVYRSDVNEHFGIKVTREVGFSIQQPFSSVNISEMPAGEYDIIVQCCDFDGKIIEVRTRKIVIIWPEDITPISFDSAETSGKNKAHDQSTNTLISKIKKVWHGHVGVMESELQRHLFASKVTAKGLLSVNAVSDRLWPAVTYVRVKAVTIVELLRQASQNGGLVVIFDHNFGGGANLFSHRMVVQNKKTHNVVLRVWYEPATTMVMGNVSYLESDYSIEVGGLNELFSLLTAFKSTVTHINNLYAWPHIERVLDNIVRLRVYGLTGRVEYFAHDHIAICPSLFL